MEFDLFINGFSFNIQEPIINRPLIKVLNINFNLQIQAESFLFRI